MATESGAKLYQAREVAHLLEVPVRRVESWTEHGFITPRVRGKGKGSRHGFDLSNLVEGVMLLAIQAVVGEHSPAPWTVLALLKDRAAHLAEALSRGAVLAGERLVLAHSTSGTLVAIPQTELGPAETRDEQLAVLLSKFPAVTFVDLTGPLTGLAQRIREQRL